jgi:peptide deformylase
MKTLRRTQFGNPVLRETAQRLSADEITSPKIQELIANMRWTLQNKPYGIGLAAPQVGQGMAISVIGIKPTPSRPGNPTLDMVIINPEIVATHGEKEPMWEGCVSFGDTRNFPYALVPRYARVRLRWHDERAQQHEQDFDGITAHVLQHETDHLNGVLFVDRVEDTMSYMTISEYKRRYVKP